MRDPFEGLFLDELTGLYNRRHLNPRLQEELTQARRSGESLASLLLGLDHFRDTNGAASPGARREAGALTLEAGARAYWARPKQAGFAPRHERSLWPGASYLAKVTRLRSAAVGVSSRAT